MAKAEVSIVIPVYNAEKTITKCVDSVLYQSFKNFELILIDDGSQDDSLRIINDLSLRDDRIRIISKENEGVSVTRNRGIQTAIGEFLFFVDNDDFLDKDYISTFVSEMKHKSLDILLGGYKRVSRDNEILYQQSFNTSRINNWSKYNIVAPWARGFRLDFLQSNQVDFFDYGLGEDVVFNLKAYQLTTRIGYIDYVGYNWFFNDDSVSNTSQKGFNKNLDIRVLFDEIKRLSNNDPYLKYFVNRYKVWYLLFSGRTASSKSFMEELNKINLWIKDEKFESSISPLSRRVSTDSLRNRFALLFFNLLEQVKLINFFARFYCQNKD